MNKSLFYIFGLLLQFVAQVFGQDIQSDYKKSSSFFPDVQEINKENIQWGYFTVPENWQNLTHNKVKLAIAILKKTSKKGKGEAVLMIEGGPGAGAIESIWKWLDHPLRENHDIILMDIRGTGFSEPHLCPELGKTFLKILAKNQEPTTDEKEKLEAALACQQDIIAKGIDINSYDSNAISNDIHALKEYLNFKNWDIYGVSYGTYTAQIYAQLFPNDIKSLILDSPISNINEYYALNTSNYIKSLEKVFKACKEDPNCNLNYPDLEKIYYKTVEDLETKPITVFIDENIVSTGTFTYNSEDFKIAIHQSLYRRELIEVLPLLIYQFHEGNKAVLSSLVSSFSGALTLDYGMYYCVTCNEAIPDNSIQFYNNDVIKQKKLHKGLSFYKSDLIVCNQWNKRIHRIVKKVDLKQKSKTPTLILSGRFDPITPSNKAKYLLKYFEKGQFIEGKSYGHALSFSRTGFNVVNNFISSPNNKVNIEQTNFNKSKIKFANSVYVNAGVSSVSMSLNSFDFFFFIPLCIAILVLIISIFAYSRSLFINNEVNISNKIIKAFLLFSCILALVILTTLYVGINKTAFENFYILAFGLPQDYAFVFKLLMAFVAILIIITILFLSRIKYLEDRSSLFTVLFSNILIIIYFLHWGIL